MSPPTPRFSDTGHLLPSAKPRGVKLVRDDPTLLRKGTLLTDGRDGYRIDDSHRKNGSWWFYIVNVATTQGNWFAAIDLAELAYGKGESRTEREGPSR